MPRRLLPLIALSLTAALPRDARAQDSVAESLIRIARAAAKMEAGADTGGSQEAIDEGVRALTGRGGEPPADSPTAREAAIRFARVMQRLGLDPKDAVTEDDLVDALGLLGRRRPGAAPVMGLFNRNRISKASLKWLLRMHPRKPPMTTETLFKVIETLSLLAHRYGQDGAVPGGLLFPCPGCPAWRAAHAGDALLAELRGERRELVQPTGWGWNPTPLAPVRNPAVRRVAMELPRNRRDLSRFIAEAASRFDMDNDTSPDKTDPGWSQRVTPERMGTWALFFEVAERDQGDAGRLAEAAVRTMTSPWLPSFMDLLNDNVLHRLLFESWEGRKEQLEFWIRLLEWTARKRTANPEWTHGTALKAAAAKMCNN